MGFNEKDFRNALGSFTTGVTIVTTMEPGGTPTGLTVNSFASVSLQPPLVLWSIDKQSGSCETFVNSGHFAIHILYKTQQPLSKLFSSKSDNKFNGISWNTGMNGSPILPDYISCFECTTESTYEGGDHIILLGRVNKYDIKNDEPPLLFHSGEYK